jgi:hypothetical protein
VKESPVTAALWRFRHIGKYRSRSSEKNPEKPGIPYRSVDRFKERLPEEKRRPADHQVPLPVHLPVIVRENR